jgi:hypothetical protein
MGGSQQPISRDLGLAFKDREIPRESTDNLEPASLVEPGGIRGEACPSQGKVNRQRSSVSDRIGVTGEI